ncbi:MAG TPA: creatininase family protein [Sandaracinaceae bacterium]
MIGARVAELAWTEIEERLARGAIAVLPIGAASKEHGPHLPMSTDWLTAEALGARLAATSDVLVWPAVGYGFYPAFVDYPGSTSVPEDVFRATLAALLGDLVRAGASGILVLNTGISTIRAVDAVVSTPGAPPRAAVHVYRGARYVAEVAAVCEQPRGGHADEAETSVMLHLHPERVRMERAPTWTREMKPGRFHRTDASSPSYSPSGIYGDATLATAEKGARLVRAMLEDALEAIDRLRRG